MKNNAISIMSRSKSFLYPFIIFYLFMGASQNSFAVSKYYVFEGTLTTLWEPYTRTATKAGYELGDYLYYVVEIDFERQGFYISPTSGMRVTPEDSDTIDYFYAYLVRGSEMIHTGLSGVVYDNFGANYLDASQSYINLANYLVLKNGVNPIDWEIGNGNTSSDRWDGYGNERLDGSLTLVNISDVPPVDAVLLKNWSEIQFDREIANFFHLHPVSNSVFVGARPYGGIYEKPSNSNFFSTRNNGLIDTNVKDLAFSPASASTLYIATLHGGIYKSINGGSSWVKSNNGIETRSNQSTDVYSIAVSPSNTDLIFAGTLFGLYKSIDGGDNWQLEVTPFNDHTIQKILVTAENEILVGTNEGLYQGTVEGNSWINLLNIAQNISNNTASITDIKLHPTDQNIVAIGLQGIGAYFYYRDSGTWERLSLPRASAVEEFLINFTGDFVYVVATQSGLFRSEDFTQWERVVLPMVNGQDIFVNTLAVDQSERLFIGSNHNGIFSIEKSMQETTPLTSSEVNNVKNIENDNSGGGGGSFAWGILPLVFLFRRRLAREDI